MGSKEAKADVKALESMLEGFGRYGNEDIKWRVLDVDGDKALIISENGLDAQKFNPRTSGNVWKESEIRRWLNGTFLETVFNEAEKARIIPSVIETESTESEDKIFLLDYSELEEYLPSGEERALYPSEYAKNSGARLKNDAGCWWLRTPSSEDNFALCVYYSGDVCAVNVGKSDILVRPALRIKLSNDAPADREVQESLPVGGAAEPARVYSGEVGVIFGYLKVFPKDLGKNFKKVPNEIIGRVNSNSTYGYNTWRLPTEDELSLLAENGFINNAGDYMSDEKESGSVRLVTDKNTAEEIAAEEAKRLEQERLKAERLEAERRAEAERLRRAGEQAEKERLEAERRARLRYEEEQEEKERQRKKRNKIVIIAATLLILAGGGAFAAMNMDLLKQKPKRSESVDVAAAHQETETRKNAEKAEKNAPEQKSEPVEAAEAVKKAEAGQTAAAEPEQKPEPVKTADPERRNAPHQKAEPERRNRAVHAEAARKAQERRAVKAKAEEEPKAREEEPKAKEEEKNTETIVKEEPAVQQPKSDEVRKAGLEQIKAGFGTYEGSAIRWRVLAYDKGRALIISERGIAARRFDGGSGNWAGSEIRRWLNDTFYNSSFSASEQSQIVPHQSTGDRVFLLSKAEAELYLPKQCSRVAYPTAGARSKAYISTSTSYCNGGSEGAVFWWLRTVGSAPNYAKSVSFDGSIGDFEAHNPDFVVRPAIWVNF